MVGKPEGRDHLGSLGVDGLIMLEWISREWMWVCGLEWAEQDMDMWPALVNAVMNILVP